MKWILLTLGKKEDVSGGFVYNKCIANCSENIEVVYRSSQALFDEYLKTSEENLLIDAWGLHEVDINDLPPVFSLLVHHPIALDEHCKANSQKEELIWSKAKKIIVTGKVVFDYVKKITDVPVLLVEPGINEFPEHKPNKHKTKLRLCSVGAIIERKGDDFLLEVMALLKDSQDIELHRVGKIVEKDYYEKLLQNIEELGLKNHVIWHSNLDDKEKNEVLMKCDLAVFPTKYESYGMAIQESLSSGIPVMVSPLEGMKNRFGRHGVQYTPRNVKKWADKLRFFIQNTNEVNQLYDNLLQHPLKVKTWDQQAVLMCDFLSSKEC